MLNFKSILSEILEERDKTFADLEENNIISERTFYQYKNYTPYLTTVIKIANYLNVSLDYMSGKTSENHFKPYKETQIGFYDKLIKLLSAYNISQSKLAREINISRPNFHYWKNGKLPKFDTLIALATYLNCSIDDLLDTE